MQLGIIGLPQSGKTTVFNALTKSEVKVGDFTGTGVHLGSVKVPDPRLDRLSEMYRPKKTVHATVNYVDVGGMAKGAAEHGGLGPEFLHQFRLMDAALVLLRGFDGGQGAPDPLGDWRSISAELLLADMDMVARRVERLKKDMQKSKKPEMEKELYLLDRCQRHLECEKPISSLGLGADESKQLRCFQLLTEKPAMIILNHAEGADPKAAAAELERETGLRVLPVCGPVEMDIAQMPDDDARAFLAELGIGEPAMDRVVRESYRLLGKMTFFTVGEDECRAWTVDAGATALRAAGTIHSDLERGFIKAEVVSWENLTADGSLAHAREKGHLKLEGKDHVISDGDIVHIKFNV